MHKGKKQSRITELLHRAGILHQGIADAASVHYVRVSDVFRGKLAWDERLDSGLLEMLRDPDLVAEIKTIQHEVRRTYLLNQLGELERATK